VNDRGARRPVMDLARERPVTLVVVGAVLYSTGPVFVQAASASGPVFSLWRLWFGVGVFGLATVVHGVTSGRWAPVRTWGWAVGAGVAFGVHQLMLFMAIKATSVADVTLITALGPVVTALLALPFFGERPGARFRAWSVLAMAGTAVVVFGGAAGPEGDVVGMSLALGNVVFFAIFFLLSKAGRAHLDVIPFLFGVMVVASLTTLAYVAVTDEQTAAVNSLDLVYAAIVAVGPGAVGHLVSTWPLRFVPVNVPPLMQLSIPALAAIWAWWFLGEAITLWHLLGGVIIAVGVLGAVGSRSGRAFVRSGGHGTAGREGPTR
jgi:drug/metabolite transporter (DMT)-like permease